MLLGFSDQAASDRVLADARPFFRRISSDLRADQFTASEVVPGRIAPAGWLAHGGLRFGRLVFDGHKPLAPGDGIGGRRCIVPGVDSSGEPKMVAGVWMPGLNGIDPRAFRIVEVDGEMIDVAPLNWDNWLNPSRDARPMLRRSERLVVPGH